MNIDLLHELLSIDSPSGDEHRMADWLTGWIAANVQDAHVERLRDCLIVTKGESPQVALFAHIDTCGFTVAYGNELSPIGSPKWEDDQPMRVIGQSSQGSGHLSQSKRGKRKIKGLDCNPGNRLVYAAAPKIDKGRIIAPYLDNRGGVWAALLALNKCERIAIAFTSGEETGASGARICARHLWEKHRIAKALISDITWDTPHVHCGNGVAISRRDSLVPPQRYVDRVVSLAESSGIPYQIEIESSGGSDGSGIEYSSAPMDWVFVGAPEMRPHSGSEEVDLGDLEAMRDMLIYLVDRLSEE